MSTLLRATLPLWLFACLALSPASAKAADEKPVDLKVGDPAPVFDATDDQARPWKSADHAGKKYMVVYFYPGDFTPGCTAQARRFQADMNKMTEQGIVVVGISGDAAATHALFKKAQKLNFTLLSDEEGTLAKKFGVPLAAGAEVKTRDADGKPLTLKRAVTAGRWTFIIGKDGKVLYKNTKVDPVKDSAQVAAFIEKLEKK
jgi:peroxiredoxin Q/BCP